MKISNYFFAILMLIFINNLFGQHINNNVLNNVEKICDSIYNSETSKGKHTKIYLNFVVKYKIQPDTNIQVLVKYLFNYSSVKYYQVNYLTDKNEYLILHNIDPLINKEFNLNSIKTFCEIDTLLLKRTFLDEKGSYIHSRDKPLTFKVAKDGNLIYMKKDEDFIDNPNLLPPVKIEKFKW